MGAASFTKRMEQVNDQFSFTSRFHFVQICNCPDSHPSSQKLVYIRRNSHFSPPFSLLSGIANKSGTGARQKSTGFDIPVPGMTSILLTRLAIHPPKVLNGIFFNAMASSRQPPLHCRCGQPSPETNLLKSSNSRGKGGKICFLADA